MTTETTTGTLLQRLWNSTLFWIISDALFINLAFALAYYIRYQLQWLRTVDPANNVPYTAFIPFLAVLTPLLILTYRQKGVYRKRRRLSWADEFTAIFEGTTIGIMFMIVVVFIYQPTFYSRIIFIYAWLLISLLLGLSRLIRLTVLRRWRRQGYGIARLLIVGAGEIARTLMRTVVANPAFGYKIIGFVDDDETKGSTDIGPFKALGQIANLPTVLQAEAIDEVIITLPWQYQRKINGIAAQCERAGIRVRIVPDLFQMSLNRLDFSNLAGVPLIGIQHPDMGGIDRLIKRIIDLIAAAFGMLIVSPVMALVALAIKIESSGPVFFSQERIGKNGKPFRIYKFRSMVVDAEAQKNSLESLNEADGPLFKIKEDPRRTTVGRLIRKFSLDELPQLYNVLVGEMSLTGPRPNVPEEVAQYQEWQKTRLDVLPGITGLWAVSGRSELTFDEMMLLDIYYIENWSLSLDIKILLQTVPRVLLGSGAY